MEGCATRLPSRCGVSPAALANTLGVRWEPNMPIGQLQLELFFDTFYTADETINVLSTGGTIEYNMNLLISEV